MDELHAAIALGVKRNLPEFGMIVIRFRGPLFEPSKGGFGILFFDRDAPGFLEALEIRFPGIHHTRLSFGGPRSFAPFVPINELFESRRRSRCNGMSGSTRRIILGKEVEGKEEESKVENGKEERFHRSHNEMDFRMKKDPPLKEARRSRAERIVNVNFLRYSLHPCNEKSSRKVARSQSLKEGSHIERFQNARQGRDEETLKDLSMNGTKFSVKRHFSSLKIDRRLNSARSDPFISKKGLARNGIEPEKPVISVMP
jgi:hypothetical protein